MGGHLPVQQLEHLHVELARLRSRSNPKVCVRISLNDLHGGNLAMPANISVGDVDDGVDVGVGLLYHLGQVLHRHERVVEVDLQQENDQPNLKSIQKIIVYMMRLWST